MTAGVVEVVLLVAIVEEVEAEADEEAGADGGVSVGRAYES